MPNFNDLWNNHPGSGSQPCNETKFENQCAIRMGIAFQKSGIDLKKYKGAKCWFWTKKGDTKHKPKAKEKLIHVLRAKELKEWVDKKGMFGKGKKYRRTRYQRKHKKPLDKDEFKNKAGLIYINNGWGNTDHIDLWDGNQLLAGEASWLELGNFIQFWEMENKATMPQEIEPEIAHIFELMLPVLRSIE